MSAPSFHEIRWSWASSKVDARRTAYMGMDGRISVADLIAYMAEIAPGVPPDEMMLNWSTVVWSRPANEAELAERAERDAVHAARTEQWERETLARLQAKYAGDV